MLESVRHYYCNPLYTPVFSLIHVCLPLYSPLNNTLFGGADLKEKRYGLDLTQGKISTVLLKFAGPFVAANLVNALHGVISMLVVGMFAGSEVISGVATGSQVLFPLYSFMMGLGTSGTVLIARSIGEKNKEAGTKALGSFTITSAALVVFLTLFMIFMREPLIVWLRTPADAIASARRYVVVSTFGTPFNVAFTMLSAIARGIGNSKAPSIIASISCVINIALSLLFVGVFGLAEAGVAAAASVAQFISFICIGVWLLRCQLPFPFTVKDIRPDGKSIRYLLVVGFPVILQELLVSISFMINMNRVNILGVEASASVGVVSRIFNIAAVIPNSIGSAISAITAQSLGAGLRKRALSSMKWGMLYAAVTNTAIMLFCMIWPDLITSLFSSDPVVISGASNYLVSFIVDCSFVAFLFSLNAYLNGCGKSHVTMWYQLISAFLVRVPLSIYITGILDLEINKKLFYLGFASPLASIVAIVIGVVYIVRYNRRESELAVT